MWSRRDNPRSRRACRGKQADCWQLLHLCWDECESAMLADRWAVDMGGWLTEWQIALVSPTGTSNRCSKLPRYEKYAVIKCFAGTDNLRYDLTNAQVMQTGKQCVKCINQILNVCKMNLNIFWTSKIQTWFNMPSGNPMTHLRLRLEVLTTSMLHHSMSTAAKISEQTLLTHSCRVLQLTSNCDKHTALAEMAKNDRPTSFRLQLLKCSTNHYVRSVFQFHCLE